MKQLFNYLYITIKKQKNLVRFNIILFFIGLLAGSFFINIITKSDKEILINQVVLFIDNSKSLNKEVFGLDIFISNIFNNGFQLLLIFFLGLSIIGIPIVILTLFFKGFMLGVTLGTFILKFNLKGVLLVILYIIPSQLFSIATYIFICFFAVYSSLIFIRAIIKKENLNFKMFIGKYTFAFIISVLLITVLSFIEAYITPFMIKLFTYAI